MNKFNGLKPFLDPRALTMLFYGFSAGLPLLMIFSSLSLWLREAGVERGAVTYFSWAALGLSFKFVWSPLIDKLPLPFLTRLLGRRRSWIVLSQCMVMSAIIWMALVDPASSLDSLTYMAMAAVLLGFSSGTQDIVIDAYRIESAPSEMQAILSATYIAGYRIGMIVSGAGALFLASYLGSTKAAYSYAAWKWTYIIMAMFMLVGIITTIIRPEPETYTEKAYQHSTKDYLQFFGLFLFVVICFVGTFIAVGDLANTVQVSMKQLLNNSAFGSLMGGTFRLSLSVLFCVLVIVILNKTKLVNTEMIEESYLSPIKQFFNDHGNKLALLILLLIGTYRISDIVLGVISNVFYQDLGFTKDQIAAVVKTFGLVMTIVGGFVGGIFTVRYGVIKMLFWGAILSAGTNLLFLLLAKMGNNLPMLYVVISADNLSAGLASAAFVAFLSSLTNVEFTAVQYAIFSSLMTLLPKVVGGYSGGMVDVMGYPAFFTITAIMGLPVLYLIWLCGKKFDLKPRQKTN